MMNFVRDAIELQKMFLKPINSGNIDKLRTRPLMKRSHIARSKYMPHQGKQECARRAAKLA